MNLVYLHKQRYKIEKVIGEGGMGRVWLAYDSVANRKVVIKQNIVKNEKIVMRVQREYYFLCKIDHPNIVKALDFFFENSDYFIVMEYVRGITLNHFIRKSPYSLSIQEQLRVAIDICKAAAVINEYGIVHRDLKPSNIILDKDLQPIIVDLGIAKNIDDELDELTQKGEIIGTPSYASPEQIDGKTEKNSDVFSLGVIFYQFFAWLPRSPFHGANTLDTVNRILNEDLPQIVRQDYSEFYGKLNKILRSAMHKQSQYRLKSCYSLCCLLEELCIGNISFFEDNTKTDPSKTTQKIILKQNTSARLKLWILLNKRLTVSLVLLIVLSNMLAFSYFRRIFSQNREMSKSVLKIVEDEALFTQMLQQGKVLVGAKKFEQAKEKLKIAHRISPQNLEINDLLVKCHLQLKNYKLLILHVNRCIDSKPWYYKYYQLRAIAHRELGHFEQAVYDFLKCIDINRDKGYLLEDVYPMIEKNLSIFTRFILVRILNEEVYLHYLNVQVDLFENEKKFLSELAMSQKVPQHTSNINVTHWINAYFIAPNQQETIFDKLVSVHYSQIIKTVATEKIPVPEEALKQLQNSLLDTHKQRLRKLITKYFMAKDNESLISIEQNRKVDISILNSMVWDENESDIMRYYIACALWQIGDVDFFINALRGDRCVGQLIAKIVLKESQFFVVEDLQHLKNAAIFNEKDIAMGTPFLKGRIAFLIPRDKSLFEKLIFDSDRKVRLYAARRLWYSNTAIFDMLCLMLEESKNYSEKAFILDLLWSNPILFRQSKEKLSLKLVEYMGDNVHPLIQRIASIHAVKLPFFQTKNAYLNKLNGNNFLLKLHAIAALSFYGDKAIDEIIGDKKESAFLRLSPFVYAKHTRSVKNSLRMFLALKKIFNGNNRHMKFFATLKIYGDSNISPSTFRNYFKSEDNYSHRLAICLALDKQRETLRLTKKWMMEPNENLSNLASTATMYKQMHFEKKDAKQIYREWHKKKERIRKAASFGSSYLLYKKYYFPKRFFSPIQKIDNEYYEKYFEKLHLAIQNKQTQWAVLRCTEIAEMIYSDDRTKLERAVVLFLIGKTESSLQLFSRMQQFSTTAKYWHAYVLFSSNRLKKADKFIKKAILERPWSLRLRKLKLKIDQEMKNKQ